jgi:hypothetical protein
MNENDNKEHSSLFIFSFYYNISALFDFLNKTLLKFLNKIN